MPEQATRYSNLYVENTDAEDGAYQQPFISHCRRRARAEPEGGQYRRKSRHVRTEDKRKKAQRRAYQVLDIRRGTAERDRAQHARVARHFEREEDKRSSEIQGSC